MEHTEEAVKNFVATDTSALQERLVAVEERVQFNNKSTAELYEGLEKLDVEMGDMEDKLSAWMERELSKVYDIINDNPLGN